MIAKALFSLFILLQPGPILVDKIAAIVNEEIITIHDIERAIAFFPLLRQNNESEENFYFRVLADLITYKVIALEFSDEFNLSEEDFEHGADADPAKSRLAGKIAGRAERFHHELERL